MKRNIRRLLAVLILAVNIALAVVLWRSGDPAYRFQELLALGRYGEHDDLITRIAMNEGVDPMLVKALVWRESRFAKGKIGSAGERGLMQVGEAAAREWAEAHKVEVFVYADLFDAKTNLEAGTWYLARALEYWKDRDDPIPFALAEYNAGRSRVERWSANAATAAAMMSRAGTARRYAEDVIRRYRHYRQHGW